MLNNPNFNDESAAFVNRVANAEGINAGLLGFTFQHEGGFNLNSPPNPNRSKDVHDWDWGPFQLNYNQTILDTYASSYSWDGLDIHSVFGDLNLLGPPAYRSIPFKMGVSQRVSYIIC
jgi:hypothetical protein